MNGVIQQHMRVIYYQKNHLQKLDKVKINFYDYSFDYCYCFKASNGTEREECIAYNFGSLGTNLLCLSDDYCSQKYPFICEMNAASMKLANSEHHGKYKK